MKRWLGWLFLAVGVIMLLWIPHRPVSPPLHRGQLGIDRCSARANSFPPGAELCGPRVLPSLGIALATGIFRDPLGILDYG
jgi:hypothetical protein